MRKVLLSVLVVFAAISAMAQSNAAWLRYPAISPDGKTIAFGYKGDIYRVDASGGVAVPLTIHEAQDMMPVWSHDGKYIAFASDRYGNFDVFVMPATGGTPTRITYNSAGDYPFDFSTDNQQIIFGSARNVQASNVRFYSPRLFQNLYSVSITGGTPVLVSGAGMERAHYNSKGSQIVFEDRKGYEDPWRKHHTSSVTRDIWVMDVASKQYRKISGFEGEDREPVYSSDDQFVYYLSEKNGNQNIYKTPLKLKIAEQQLTKFNTNPVRHLSVSSNNTLCFTQDGDIYTLQEGGNPKKLPVQIFNDGRQNVEKNVPVNGNVGEFSLSPNGKEIAFVTRGEVFVTSVDGSQTKRITNTPQQERMVEWSPDGKTLIYAAERNDNWDIYTTSIVRKEEPYFYAATVLKEEPLIATTAEEFLPKYSPDGKEVAYLENRNLLKVYNIATKQSRTIIPKGHNYSYADGDLNFNWSPDGKYLLADDEYFGFGGAHAAIIKADGSGKIEHPINSGFSEGNPKWAMDGKLMTWVNNKDGRRSIAFQGNREVDIYGAFLDQATFDQFKLSKDDYTLFKEKSSTEKKDSTAKKDSAAKKWSPDFSDIDNRRVRLTINSSSISDYVITADGSKIYYLAAFEKGYDLWVTEPRTKETKILAKLAGSPSGIELSKDGKSVFVTNNGSLVKIDDSGKPTPISIASEMVLDAAKERAYIFDHCWRQVKEKFYDPTIHGIDWKMYKDTYAKFLPHINNNYDFQELLSEMLGELNGSHTGGRYSPQMQNPDVTAALGLLYDETYTGNGLKVSEVIAGGPIDKAISKIKAGCIIEKIDGENLVTTEDWAKYLNRKVGKNTLLSVLDPKSNTRFEEAVKPILFAEESALMYKRWTNMMYNLVDKLSGGKVGYVHVQGMNDGSYRTTIDEVMGRNKNKEALIVDTRFNGGGWLHNDLNTFLSGKSYLSFAPQGNPVPPTEPMDRWSKPSCVVMSEGNYSDAFIFPYVYKANGIGKLIGMPVPGTGTAVWWETQIDPTIVFGIPMVATIGKENRPTENLQLEPDMKVLLPYEDLLNGKDSQIEAAVKEMLKSIGK
jgi:Tol biopolymer transport system component/C-terminal processing protease CtpA/Prc